MALTPKGKQVKNLVLENLEIYVDARIQNVKRRAEREFNEHASEQGGKGLKIGTSKEIRDKYDPLVDELLKWKRYKEAIQDLK